jgi:hypothetical protein
MFKQAIAATLLSVLFAAFSSAQVIYEPVQYQYRTPNGETFYYAGDNPRVFEYARQRLECFGGIQAYPTWLPGAGYLRRGLIGDPAQFTFSDCAPYRNAVVFGYTSVDVRNEAYARVPQFFRMSDLNAAAVPAADGIGMVVPAQARGTIDIRPSGQRPATGPATTPKPILIIPKKALEQKSDPERTASARR